MSREEDLELLESLSDDALAAVTEATAQALLLGDGWLQRDPDNGVLRARDAAKVTIEEKR